MSLISGSFYPAANKAPVHYRAVSPTVETVSLSSFTGARRFGSWERSTIRTWEIAHDGEEAKKKAAGNIRRSRDQPCGGRRKGRKRRGRGGEGSSARRRKDEFRIPLRTSRQRKFGSAISTWSYWILPACSIRPIARALARTHARGVRKIIRSELTPLSIPHRSTRGSFYVATDRVRCR